MTDPSLGAGGLSSIRGKFLGRGFVRPRAAGSDRGVKDWGRTIEGYGGMLDRLDSVIFVASIFFHMTRYWFTM
jgi:predicted CDP-diglyceride synthetase/phosphatidate cytidylyltransferase